MPNLGVLEILERAPDRAPWNQPEPRKGRQGQNTDGLLDSQQVNDRLVRGWSLTRPDPFPALRVLRLWGCSGDTLTQTCLQYAAEFPLLAHFDVSVEYKNQQATPGTWSEAVQAASASGWTGFSAQKQSFQYSPPLAVPSKSTGSAVLTLNMVEDQTILVEALHWGSRLYSFLTDTAYGAGKTKNELSMAVATAGRSATEPLKGHFALMSLGSDQAARSQILSRQGNHTFCFVRTQDALASHTTLKTQRTTAAMAIDVEGGSVGRRPAAASFVSSGDRRRNREQLQPSSTAKKRKAGRSIGSMLGDFTT